MFIRKKIFKLAMCSMLAGATTLTLSQIQLSNNESQKINFDAFKNLAQNMATLTAPTAMSFNEVENKHIEEMVISSISKQLDREIKGHRILRQIATAPKTIKKTNKKLTVENKLDNYEINNRDEFELKKFSSAKITLANIEIPKIKDTEIVDEVKNLSASIEKEVEDEKFNDDTEMVQFDYTSKNIDQNLYERPISNNVKEAIKREMSNEIGKIKSTKRAINISPTNEISTEEATSLINETEDQVGFTYAAPVNKANNFASLEVSKKEDIEVKIRTVNVDMKTAKKAQGHSFEFLPDYDRSDRIYDNGSGEVQIGYSSVDKISAMTGIIEQRGMVPTRVELVMNTHNQIIPSFEEESFSKFLEPKGITSATSILLSVPESVKDVEIDASYAAKIYLDRNYKESDKEKQFVMFLGVNAGNTLVRYQLENETSEKIVYVGENEIYFEEPTFVESTRENFELTTRGLMSTRTRDLNVDGDNLKYFNTKNNSKKVALNIYQLRVPALEYSSRKYVELNSQGNSLFLGSDKSGKIEVPTKEFVELVLGFNEVRSLDDRCLIQLNLKKEVSNMKVTGKNVSGDMYLDISYLDADGSMTKESPENAEKVFILGEREGIVSARLDYSDGSTEVLKTMCSNGTYLIEQL